MAASGALDAAEAILAAHPEVSGSSIHIAALTDDASVRRFLALDPGSAAAPGATTGPHLASADGTLPAALAVRTGRADVLDLFGHHGYQLR